MIAACPNCFLPLIAKVVSVNITAFHHFKRLKESSQILFVKDTVGIEKCSVHIANRNR